MVINTMKRPKKIDKRCEICPIGPSECIRRIEEKYGRRPIKLRPVHPWTLDWCPYIRGFRPQSQEKQIQKV
ncbi:MAG: hypothetical protein DRJ40_07205 [Thermoprotei archaeon]|nr:MAG: hypothetical protein DRJ40_07205 [Thermoprotei archaeon]